MNASISPTWEASGQKNALLSTASQSNAPGRRSPICATCARTRIEKFSASHFLATTPAATRIVVSRAELRPPPRGSRTPYFCQ